MTTTFSRYEMFAVHVNYNNWSRDFLKNLFGNFFYAILCRFFVEKIKTMKKIRKKEMFLFQLENNNPFL